MKKFIQSIIPALAVCALLAGSAYAGPLGAGVWHEIHPGFKVQNRTNAPLAQRYTNVGGVITTTVFAGEQRVELRWDSFPNEHTFNQFEADMMFDAGTQHTAIHQIKSNTAHEPVYLQVNTPGTIRNGVGPTLATGMAGKWFHVNSAYNPATRKFFLWINGSLVSSGTHNNVGFDFYFKNGTYNNGLPPGGRSRASFKNIHHYMQ